MAIRLSEAEDDLEILLNKLTLKEKELDKVMTRKKQPVTSSKEFKTMIQILTE